MITSTKLLQRAQNTFCTLCLYGEYSGFGVENPKTVKVLNLVLIAFGIGAVLWAVDINGDSVLHSMSGVLIVK